jgi:hypothetical protein
MLDSLLPGPKNLTVVATQHRARLSWLVWFAGMMGLAVLISLLMLRSGPNLSQIAWIIYLAGAVIIIRQPRHGIYLITFLTIVGDALLTPSYPFAKNFSSLESLLYVHDALIFSPLEGYLILILLTWLSRCFTQRKFDLFKGPLFWPTLIFALFSVVGLGYGLATGGDVVIALWEARALFYLPLMIVLTSNLLTERKHFNYLIYSAMAAIFLEGVIGVIYILGELGYRWREVEAITEHSAAIHMNTLFVLFIAAWLFKASYSKRLVLPLLVPPVLITYLVTQRRAAFVALALALVILLIALYFERRHLFWFIIPFLAIGGLLYLAAFWNESGVLGAPAQAIKTVIAPDQLSQTDQSSNYYRFLENVNISFTIHNAPLLGVGFGQKFHVIMPLPDISIFVWYEYITHNSVLWIWMKMGIGGFFSLLYLLGMSVMMGGRAILRAPAGDMRVIALVATLYLIMHFVFAYVDMSWDGQSMLYVGAMIGIINCLEHVVAKDLPT